MSQHGTQKWSQIWSDRLEWCMEHGEYITILIILYVYNGSSSRLSGMHSCFLLIFEMLWIPGQPNIQVKKSSDPGDLINLCLLTCIQLRCNLRINNQEALDHWMSTFGPRDLSYRFLSGMGRMGRLTICPVNGQLPGWVISPRKKKTWHQRGPGVPGSQRSESQTFQTPIFGQPGSLPRWTDHDSSGQGPANMCARGSPLKHLSKLGPSRT